MDILCPIVTGDVADLQEAVEEGRDKAEPFLISWTFIPNLHAQVFLALQGRKNLGAPTDALGIVEGQALAALVQAADRAVKTAAVHIQELTFDLDLGGKGYFTLTGKQAELEAALASAEAQLRGAGAFIQSELLARPHERVRKLVHEGLESQCFSHE